MKIAIYGICKNEAAFVKRFTDSVTDADAIIIGDTGSTDGTLAAFEQTKATVHQLSIRPWRFDWARNTVLSLVPPDVDVCIKMDLDETMQPGWREKIERSWTADANRLRYFFADGFNGRDFGTRYPKSDVHARYGYLWKFPIHESLTWVGDGEENVLAAAGLVIEHRPDRSKSRGSYLNLLKIAVREHAGPRHWFWLGREHAWAGEWAECESAMQQVLAFPDSWSLERAWALRFIGSSFASRNEPRQAVHWFLRACAEAPEHREPWMHLADHHHANEQWSEAYAAIIRGMAVKQRPSHYLVEHKWWGPAAYDLAALCAWKTNHRDDARAFIMEAVKLEPGNAAYLRTAKRLGAITEEVDG